MKASTFRLIDAINREGLDNSQWGIIEDCESTKEYFGTHLDKQLIGQYIYIYKKSDEMFSFIRDTRIEPNEIAIIDWANCIYFYKV